MKADWQAVADYLSDHFIRGSQATAGPLTREFWGHTLPKWFKYLNFT
jgi:hypothetical protein